MREITTEDRCRGVLLGLAAGDRNGGPIRMALRLTESLLHCQQFDPDDTLQRYLQWWQEDGIDSGPTAGRVLQLVSDGMSHEQAVQLVHNESGGLTAGCNSAHRAAPLAMASFIADETLTECAQKEARLTHLHPLAGDVSAAVVVLCRALIRGCAWAEALKTAELAGEPETERAMLDARSSPAGTGGFAPEALQSALYFAHTSTSFVEALELSLTFAGPANYCPVLVGAIGGARWGADAIPSKVFRHDRTGDIVDRLMALTDSFAMAWASV